MLHALWGYTHSNLVQQDEASADVGCSVNGGGMQKTDDDDGDIDGSSLEVDEEALIEGKSAYENLSLGLIDFSSVQLLILVGI